MSVILSFDVEEHDRIEAAVGVPVSPALKAHYRDRVNSTTRWLIDFLAERNIKATFFVVGQIAKDNPNLVRAISSAGHEVASHSWDHQRIHRHTPASFREDLRLSKEALEQATGQQVVGYRAPTFSIMRETAWALDILAESGFAYDSSIYPVRHDRYGIPTAPRTPFWAKGERHEILEMPPLTWRLLGMNLPVAGGGYFRLLPLWTMRQGIRQMHKANSPISPPASSTQSEQTFSPLPRTRGRGVGGEGDKVRAVASPLTPTPLPRVQGRGAPAAPAAIQGDVPAIESAVATLYFHPWEFDPDQVRLPLGRLSRFRTYVGINSSRRRLAMLLAGYDFKRACDVAGDDVFRRSVRVNMSVALETQTNEESALASVEPSDRREYTPNRP
ncbi:MAG: polysaccharide deacetylase family protein [Gemmataceae bacterium]